MWYVYVYVCIYGMFIIYVFGWGSYEGKEFKISFILMSFNLVQVMNYVLKNNFDK